MKPLFALSFLFALPIYAGCQPSTAPAPPAENAPAVPNAAPVFAVSAPAPVKLPAGQHGRLMVILAPDTGQNDLRDRLTDVESARDGAAFGTDADAFPAPDARVSLNTADRTVAAFPLGIAKTLAPGTYRVQAVWAVSLDLRGADAPGNSFSAAQTMTLPATAPISLTLSETVPPETLPQETATVKWVRLRSEKLSAFYGRPIFLRAGVVLPPDGSGGTAPRLLCVRIGGFHTRYTAARRIKPYPGMVQVMLDGDGPSGDSYSTDSAVAGAFGDATVNELLPVIEKEFRCGGAAKRRFTTGGSTGGWVSLALQVYYPDTFGGCWSGFPDPLDFHAYQKINLYADKNAYVGADGKEVVSARDALTGITKWTVREECALENVSGFGGSYVSSGGQWGAWNTVFGSRDKAGRAVPFWNPVTGEINRVVVEKTAPRYDLARYCAANWKTLAPKLNGKIHLWVGERDEYFLQDGVHRFNDFLKGATPRIKYRAEYSPVAGHGWQPRTSGQVLAEMVAASKP
ncbi:MAG: hypothetical protein H7Y38_02195 [Armatimonadetes bacterium]|nr:hypothetical protein [Armatimonadota bacterium]